MILLLVFLIVISMAFYVAVQVNDNLEKSSNITLSSNLSCPPLPVLSFEIDDIDFSQNEYNLLTNAIYLADKYNITFDLGVISSSFYNNSDANTFGLYENNTDVFEIIAHGYTHAIDPSIVNQAPTGSYGEFYIISPNQSSGLNVPLSIQDNHIRNMRQIFQSYNLTTATEIFTVPYHTGDFNTTLLAEKYGYKLIIQKITSPQVFSEIRFGNVVDTQDYIDIPENNTFSSADVLNYTNQINKAISLGQKRIDVSLHPINFRTLSSIDHFFNQILYAGPDVSYGKLSDRFNC